MTDKAKELLLYLRKHENVTAATLAEELGWTKRQVDGVFTMAIQKKGLGERVVSDDPKVKYLTLNTDGYTATLDED